MTFGRKLRRQIERRRKEAARRRNKVLFEPLEPRLLLSADFVPGAADALAVGLGQFGDRIEGFLDSGGLSDTDYLLDTRLPFITQVERDGESEENVAPTLGTLFSVEVDTNWDGSVAGNEFQLDPLDTDDDDTVDAGEFIQGWFFGSVLDELDGFTGSTADFADWLYDLSETLYVQKKDMSWIGIRLEVTDATDLTDTVPIADLVFDVDFELSVWQNLAIDLGTEADALKLLYYTGTYENRTSPAIPVVTALEFGFTFGVHTGGQESPGENLDQGDFFVRKADDLNLSVTSEVTDSTNFWFNLNIGFLGARVDWAEINYDAAVKTLLVDPDAPDVLGFTTDQYGVEQTDGLVTSFNTIPSEDLAHDAGFFLRIGNAGIATAVTVQVDDTNDTLDDVVSDVNDALDTAGLGDLVTASLDGSDHLVFTLVPTTDTPLGFDNESWSDTGMLTADPDSGDATYPYEYSEDISFLLSVDGAIPQLVTVHFPDPSQEDIGFGPTQDAVLIPLTGRLLIIAQDTAEFDLRDDARFRLTVTIDEDGEGGADPSTSTVLVVVPDNNAGDIDDLVEDIRLAINDALTAEGLDPVISVGSTSDGKIVLYTDETSVTAFSISTINENLGDLVDDVNRALDTAGLSGLVEASAVDSDTLQLATTGGETLEITKTLTFDAGDTYQELVDTDTEDLFTSEIDEANSNISFVLPVSILPGLDYTPAHVAIVGNFSPFGLLLIDPVEDAVAQIGLGDTRFDLNFTYTPKIEDQDDPVPSVPDRSTLVEEIDLVNMAEPLNFNLVTAESMVGLLMGLGTALQQIADSGLFATYDIPFADAALSELLNFSDPDMVTYSGLIDRSLIYETGGDGIDAYDVEPADINDEAKLLKRIVVGEDTYLIPNFVTAQDMATTLSTILGVALIDINADYEPLGVSPGDPTQGINELTYYVDLVSNGRTNVAIDDAPFEYDVDLSPFAKLTLDTTAEPEAQQVALQGYTGLTMTFGIDLSPPGYVIYPETELSELNAGTGVFIKAERAITGDVPIAQVDPGADPPLPPISHLSGDAVFSIDIVGATEVEVTVTQESASANRSIQDLVADVNNALVKAGIGDDILADFNGVNGNFYLVLTATDPSTEFTITAADGDTNSGLGFYAGTNAERLDFVIYDSNDGVYPISLYDLGTDPTVEDVIYRINNTTTDGAVVSDFVVADFNSTQTGLQLVDTTEGGGDFRVEPINGSDALLTLGLFRTDNTGSQFEIDNGDPYLIEGGQIGLTHLDERFFVRYAELWGGLGLQTPDGGIPGSALFGIVGVDTNLEGEMYAEFTADIINPNGTADDTATLRELFEGSKPDYLSVAEPVVTEAYELNYSSAFLWPYDFAPGTMVYAYDVDSDSITGSAFVLNNDTSQGVLTVANVKGTFSGAEGILDVNSVNSGDWTKVARNTGGEATQNDSFGEFNLHVDVQDGFDDIGFVVGDSSHGFGLLDGQSYDVGFKITDFGNPYDPDPPVATFDDLSGDTGDLYAFKDFDYADLNLALKGSINPEIQGLLGILQDVEDNYGFLNDPLPAIGKTVSDLLHLVEGFERGVNNLDEILAAATLALDPEGVDLPALTLQDIPNALRGAFGLPEGVDPDGVDADGNPNVDWVTLDFDKANNMLLVEMSLNEAISTKLGLDIEVGEGLGNLTSGGVLIVEGSLDVNLRFGINLASPNDAYLFDDSSIAGNLHIAGEGQEYANDEDGLGMVFWASVGGESSGGALSVFIQDADALIDVAFELPGLDFGEGIHKKLIREVVFDNWNRPDPSSNVDINLPMFYGGEGPDNYIGDFSASGDLDELTVAPPDFSDIISDIQNGIVPYDPFDNILLGIDTLNLYLEMLTDILADEVLGIKMLFVGDQMADILFIESFRNTLYSTLKNGIENDIDPTPDDVTNLLQSAIGSYLKDSTTIAYDNNVGNPGTEFSDWYHQWNFTLAGEKTITLQDFDLGIENLGFDVDIPVQVVLGWELDLGFGVNYDEVAYIDVSDANEIDLDLTITLPQDGTGTFGYLKFNVTDPFSDTGAIMNFDVNVKNGDTTDDHLGFSDIGSINPVAVVTGTPLDGNYDTSPADHYTDADAVSLHLQTTATKGLPTLNTDLVLKWALAENTPVSSLNGDAVTPGIQLVALNGMSLDPLSVAQYVLGPFLEDISSFLQPFMPVVDTLTEPVPILSDLSGQPITLVDLAGIYGEVDPRFIEAVNDILDVIHFVGHLGTLPELPLGDLTLYQYDPVTNTVEINNFIPNDPSSDLADISVMLEGFGSPPDGSTTDGWTYNGKAYDIEGYDAFNDTIDGTSLRDLRDGRLADDLTMPIFTDPREGVRIFLGQNATIVDYPVPPLFLKFPYAQFFPVYGPLGVSIEISFIFEVDLHSIGYDTFGYQRYADGGFKNSAVLFDGLYLNDLNEQGVDDPEVSFGFGLTGAAELNLVVASGGVGGGINAIIYFDWFDPIPDGQVHFSELKANVISADPGPNPLAVFDLGGALTFELFAFLKLPLIDPINIPITPETTLLNFEYSFDHDPILATKIDDSDVLQLNIGPNSEDRIYGNTSDGHEKLIVEKDGDKVYVYSSAFGVSKGSLVNTFTGINHIVGFGGQGNDEIDLILGGSNITYELEGRLGDDTITVSGGGGGTIRGGVGNDTLTGGAGNDIIWGEEGNDIINGGDGYDILFGDEGRFYESITDADPLVTSRVRSSDGDDTINGGADDDIIIGAGGNDTLNGDAGNDVIIGDGGRFAYLSVNDQFEITAITESDLWKDPDDNTKFVYPYEPEEVDTNDPTDPAIISQDIDKIYDAVVETFHATDLFYGGNDTISGGGGGDIILGGAADDVINGDAGDDIILGGKGFDEIYGGTNNDTIFGGDQADTIYGNENDDVISGGSGNDYIHGNTGDDVMKGDSGADLMFGDLGNDQVFGQTEPDVLFGGGGDDLVVGGTSNDIMFGDDGVVAKLDPSTGYGAKVVYNDILITNPTVIEALIAVANNDEGPHWWDQDIRSLDLIQTYVVSGDGDDFLSGNAGDDFMFGGGGNDTMGGDVDPRLPTAGSPTEISEDVMIGDGGRITFDQRRYRSIATVIGTTTGSPFDDTIYGDNGNDYILGGRGNDILAGGHGPDRGATDEGASDNDIIICDNGELIFADESYGSAFGDLKFIATTDVENNTGGWDTAYGEEGADVILGGVNNDDGIGDPEVDSLYGDYYDYDSLPVPTISIGNDVILGDNGLLHFDYNDSENDLNTLDFIHSEPYAVSDWSDYENTLDDTVILGGVDIIDGSFGYDVLIGGVAGDTMYGDDETASNAANDGEDIMLGDNADIFLIGTEGRLLVQVAAMTAGTAVDLITTTDTEDETGGADTMSGNARADIMLGGVNNGGTDTMFGDRGGLNPEDQPTEASILNDGDDILLGDNGLLDFTYDTDTDRNTLDFIQSFEDALGGVDVISGNKGLDVAIGGTAGDEIYGDDPSASAEAADLGDLLLGDNADIFLVAKGEATGGDLKLVLPLGLSTDAAVKTIRTTDTVDPDNTGGSDTISGNADGDIIAGGVFGDTLYGDRLDEDSTHLDDGDDIILGDNAAFEWLSDGHLSDVLGIDISVENPELWTKFGTPVFDTDLTTLDLVTTEQPNSGGRDYIRGDDGNDFVFGGTDSDTIYGDDSDLEDTDTTGGEDLLFGDHGRIYPQFPRFKRLDGTFEPANFQSRNFFAIDVGDDKGGEGDRMWGEEGDDTMVGQQGDDRMWGGGDDDDMTGGHNVSGGYDELGDPVGIPPYPAISASLDGTGIEVPAIDDVNDLMDGGSGDDSMAGDNAIIWRRGDDFSPRFRELTEDSIYTTTPDTITANIGDDWQSDPDDAIGRDIELVDHSDTTATGLYGADVMAGGAHSDVMFGQLANDLMQGDGAIESDPVVQHSVQDYPPFISQQIDMTDTGLDPDPGTSETLYFNIPEAESDADDYMEGNGGSDLMYGGLGQDDMIGGSSALFGLDDPDPVVAESLRPDTSDFIFGGAGIAITRNDIGATTEVLAIEDSETNVITTEPDGHARDADFIMGDNANVYRLVDEATDEFLTFNYDNYTYDPDTEMYGPRIIPRAMEQLDYTLGGADYNEGEYVDGAAELTGLPADNGAADLIHGESGDDIIFGMTGSDVIFGEGQDDDIVGGYGHDWISGGTGQDGVLGDDGLILTSRNSEDGEPLNNIEGLDDRDPSTKYNNGHVLDEVIKTPGEMQYAIINVSGLLKKTADLVPFSFDPDWMGTDDEFPETAGDSPYADDIIFGGLGSDWLHGGSGDDAISGAEALENAYVPDYANLPGILNLGYAQALLPANLNSMNPGDVLAFNPEDVDGRHLNNRFRAGEFALYDEYSPLHKILLYGDGSLWDIDTLPAPTNEFLLNFDEGEGVVRPGGTVPKATGQQTETYLQVNDDGKDAIFGDLGNDWLVGGTGRDNIYGGWGNDLLNADDDQTTPGNEPKHGGDLTDNANDLPDTHPYYEDRAYGGAGRDILIANTGGDRLIDWVGEYNSYLVPYAPFGLASVSRTLMPHLQEFLYALSDGDGADPTRYSDAIGGPEPVPTINNPIPSRNGEPHGELGLVLQKDFAWQDQTGPPADPQAGNIPGGHRDVLRSAGFNDGESQIAYTASGVFEVKDNKLAVSAESLGGDAISVMAIGDYLPSYFEVAATITMEKPTGGWKANAYIIFDYQDETNFKFAGIDASRDKIQLGHRTAEGWIIDAETPSQIKPGTYYNVLVAVNGTNVTVRVDGTEYFSHTYEARVDDDGWVYGINEGMIGLGSDNSRGTFDNIVVQVLPPEYTFEATEDFADADVAFLTVPQSGDWQVVDGRYDGVPAGSDRAISLVDLGTGLRANSILDVETIVNTDATTGIVFDYYGSDDFKYAGLSATGDTLVIGHLKSGKWMVDASIDFDIESGEDYELALSLKGTTVDVSLKAAGAENWQTKLGHLFNGVVVDGAFGLLAKEGTASFDTLTVKTNDPAFRDNLMASAAPEAAAQVSALTNEDLTPIVDEAIERWIEELGGENDLLETLYDVEFQIVDFDGLILGQATPEVISIDADAAGYGWFVDDTPFDDVEFADRDGDGELTAISGSEAEGRMDLLTAVMHELGHVLGYEDVDPAAADLMSETLDTGVRQLLGNNGSGQSLESTTNLVAIDLTPDELVGEDTLDSLVKDNPWLVKYLLNGAEDDTNPNDDIAVVIPKEDPQDGSTEGSSDPVGDPNAKREGE